MIAIVIVVILVTVVMILVIIIIIVIVNVIVIVVTISGTTVWLVPPRGTTDTQVAESQHDYCPMPPAR